MSNDKPLEESPTEAPKNLDDKPSSSQMPVLFISFVSLLLVLGGGWFGYQAWQQQQAENQHLLTLLEESKQRLSSLNTQLSRLDGRLVSLTDDTRKQDHQLTQNRHELEHQSQRLTDSIRSLRRQMGLEKQDWMMAEAEYLLRIAHHRLYLEQDVNTAIIALQQADNRLHESGNPSLYTVRDLLAGEIAALKAVEDQDIGGLAMRLTALSRQIKDLPVNSPIAPMGVAPESIPSETSITQDIPKDIKTLANDAWEGFKSLVVVRKHNMAVKTLLTPAQAYFLRENIRLKLEAARMALLRRETPMFHDNLNSARERLHEYFDLHVKSTRTAIDELDALLALDLTPAYPDISTSLNALHAVAELNDPDVDTKVSKHEEPEVEASSSEDASNESADKINEETNIHAGEAS